MNIREEIKLRNWLKWRGKASVSTLDVLKAQRRVFYVVAAVGLVVALYSLYSFGLYSLPFGVFLGAFASLLGYISRVKKSIAIELKYLDWKKVEDALGNNT